MYDLIHYYYPEVKIEDKYIQNIGCVLWNKKKDVLDFLQLHTESKMNGSELYTLYCQKNDKRVSKNYFMNLVK
jgi:hypothetical protein